MDWNTIREIVVTLGAVVGGIGGFLVLKGSLWKARLEAADDLRAKAEEKVRLLEWKHGQEIEAMKEEYNRLLAENKELREKVGWQEWKPAPTNPFATPHVRF